MQKIVPNLSTILPITPINAKIDNNNLLLNFNKKAISHGSNIFTNSVPFSRNSLDENFIQSFFFN